MSYLITFIGLVRSPLLGRIVLILISVVMGLFLSLLVRKWISYLIILIFLGGIIILFTYVCTLISNLKSFVKNYYDYILIRIRLSFIFGSIIYAQYWDLRFEIKQSIISVLYVKSNFLLISICVIYLLLVLIISIKLSQKFKGRIKAKSYDS